MTATATQDSKVCSITSGKGDHWYCRVHGLGCEYLARTLQGPQLEAFTAARDAAGITVRMIADPAPPPAATATSSPSPQAGPQPVSASRLPVPGRSGPGGYEGLLAQGVHPLAYPPGALAELQAAMDERSALMIRADDPAHLVEFAALTTGTHGAPRAWGANILAGPRLLHLAGQVPQQSIDAVLAQLPTLTLPTATAAAAEGVALAEYAASTTGAVTLGRFGRFTDLTEESRVGTSAAAVTAMHGIGIALDLDKLLVDMLNTAAGAAVGFTTDVPAAIRKSLATVQAATAAPDVADLVVCVHPDNIALLQSVTPTGGKTQAEMFTDFSGALVYPSTAVPTGFMIVSALRQAARFFLAIGTQTRTFVDVKTGIQSVATFMIGGYGLGVAGAVQKIDVVTP